MAMARQVRLPFIILLLTVSCRSSLASGREEGHVCISQGGRFPPFSLEGKPPRRSIKGPDDLTLCRIYRKWTCCTAAQTHPALLSIRKLATSGEGSNECLLFWEAMECALCDPLVGVMQGPPKLCKSFCESAFNACKDAFFSFDAMNQVLLPCGSKDVICAQASKWATNGSQFCELAGYVVPSTKNIIEAGCFDGKPSLDTDFPTSKKSEKNTYKKKQSVLHLLRHLTTQLSKGDLVVWAVGGLVLTAGILLMRRQNNSSQRKKEAMIRLVREARSKHQAALTTKEKNIRKRT